MSFSERSHLVENGMGESITAGFFKTAKGKTLIGILSVLGIVGTIGLVSVAGRSNGSNSQLQMASAPPNYYTPKIPIAGRLTEGDILTQEMINQLETEFFPSTDTTSHSIIEGSMNPGDVVLKNYRRRENFSIVSNPNKTIEVTGASTISYIALIDKWTDSTGANFEITSGGVGEDHVTISIVPKYYRGFNVRVFVAGQK